MTAPTATPALSDALSLSHGPSWANRITLAPLTNWQSHGDGTLGEDEYRWLTMRAAGGFSMTMTCAAHVQAPGQGFPGQLGAWSDAHLPGLSRLAKGIRASGSVSCLQLQHSGLRADTQLTGERAVAPWDDTASGARALSSAEVQQLIDDFIAAARRAERAGFQGVELHGAHGYLLAQFLDGENNRRGDGWGGACEHRTRFLNTLIDGVRAATGADFQLGLRLSPERFGINMAESLALAQQVLADGKLDYLDMSLWDCFKPPQDPAYADRPLIEHFAALGACRAWGVDSENRPQRGQFLPDLQPHSPAMEQKDGEKWTAAVDSQPTLPKPDRLLGCHQELTLIHGCVMDTLWSYLTRRATHEHACQPLA